MLSVYIIVNKCLFFINFRSYISYYEIKYITTSYMWAKSRLSKIQITPLGFIEMQCNDQTIMKNKITEEKTRLKQD